MPVIALPFNRSDAINGYVFKVEQRGNRPFRRTVPWIPLSFPSEEIYDLLDYTSHCCAPKYAANPAAVILPASIAMVRHVRPASGGGLDSYSSPRLSSRAVVAQPVIDAHRIVIAIARFIVATPSK